MKEFHTLHPLGLPYHQTYMLLFFYSENLCINISWLVSFPMDVRTRGTLLNKKIILGK